MYSGEWKADAIIAWANLLNHQIVGHVDGQTIRNFNRKEGVIVHVLVSEEIEKNDRHAFHDFLFNEVALPVIEQKIMKRGDFSIIFSDGEENKKWVEGTDLAKEGNLCAMLIDMVNV